MTFGRVEGFFFFFHFPQAASNSSSVSEAYEEETEIMAMCQ